MKFLDKLERKHPRWGIPNLMMHITILTAIVFVMGIFRSDFVNYLYLTRAGVLEGQIWRLVSFVLVPPSWSIIWIVFILYFYYFVGNALESAWGTLKFTAYYVICMLATIAAAMIFGGGYAGTYVNLSLFLAFAFLYPDLELLLFFVLPIKVKYLAYIDVAFLLISFITGTLTTKLAIVASLAGFLIFFGQEIYRRIKMWIRREQYKNKMKR
ncbi:MAG: hypothetical protein ACC608_01180 [Anaerofustis sp.]